MKPLQLPGSGKRPSFTEQSTTLALVQAWVVAAGSGREVVVADPEAPDPEAPDPGDPDPTPPPEAEQEPPLLAPMSM